MEEMVRKILELGVSLGGKYSSTLSTAAVALSFIMSIFRVVYMAYEKGMDQWSVYARKQAGLFFVIVALCFPVGLFGDQNSTFLTHFPAMIIKAGLSGIDSSSATKALTAGSYDASLASAIRDSVNKNGGNSGKADSFSTSVRGMVQKIVDNMKTTNDAFGSKCLSLWTPGQSFGNALRMVGIAVLVFLPIGFATLPVFFFNVWVGVGVLFLELLVCFDMAAMMACPEISEVIQEHLGGGVTVPVGDTVVSFIFDFVRAAVREMGIVMFYTALTFGFFGSLISIGLKAAVFSATFPISIVNLAFEKQTSVFVQNVIKIFSLAITPFILVTTFEILIGAFGVVVGGGMFDKVMESFVIANYNASAASEGVVAGALELYALLFRLLISCFLSPSILCIPAVAVMLQSHKIAGELLGSAIGYSTGLSQGFTRSGGTPGVRGMGG